MVWVSKLGASSTVAAWIGLTQVYFLYEKNVLWIRIISNFFVPSDKRPWWEVSIRRRICLSMQSMIATIFGLASVNFGSGPIRGVLIIRPHLIAHFWLGMYFKITEHCKWAKSKWQRLGLNQKTSPPSITLESLKWYMKCFIYWTADLKSSELWSSQLWTQFKQLRIDLFHNGDQI